MKDNISLNSGDKITVNLLDRKMYDRNGEALTVKILSKKKN